MLRLLICLVTIIALPLAAEAQDPPSDFQAWSSVNLIGKVSEASKLLYWFDGHARFGDDASDLATSIIRPAIGWQATPDLQLFLGYARVTAHLPSPNIDEDRIWQQALYSLPGFAGGSLGGRTRLEQRFQVGGDAGWRLRQFIRWGRPIADSKFSAVVWDELFINFNDTDWGQASGFDQNRLFVGAAYQTSKNTRLEAGYLNNILSLNGPGTQVNHNISVAFFLSL